MDESPIVSWIICLYLWWSPTFFQKSDHYSSDWDHLVHVFVVIIKSFLLHIACSIACWRTVPRQYYTGKRVLLNFILNIMVPSWSEKDVFVTAWWFNSRWETCCIDVWFGVALELYHATLVDIARWRISCTVIELCLMMSRNIRESLSTSTCFTYTALALNQMGGESNCVCWWLPLHYRQIPITVLETTDNA